MSGYKVTISKSLFEIFLNNNTNERHEYGYDEWSHYKILAKTFEFMKTRGFEIGGDKRIDEEYPSLSKNHWQGRKKNLEFKAERYPTGFKIEFYQNVNTEHPSGGYYEFNKFEKAPYLIKLLWINEMKYMAEFFKTLPYIHIQIDDTYKTSEDKIKKHYQSHFNNTITRDFKLSDLDGLKGCDEYRKSGYKHNSFDRDGKLIINGSIKYFRDYKGRLKRGKVYHNINNMWWVILNNSDYTNIGSVELFDATEEDFKVRRMQLTKKESMEISTEFARNYFKRCGLSYADITRADIKELHKIIESELEDFHINKISMKMSMNPVIKTKCSKKRTIEHAFLYVDGGYFERRECISFNRDGFIGFAGWASDNNKKPIISGFVKWCNYILKSKN